MPLGTSIVPWFRPCHGGDIGGALCNKIYSQLRLAPRVYTFFFKRHRQELVGILNIEPEGVWRFCNPHKTLSSFKLFFLQFLIMDSIDIA